MSAFVSFLNFVSVRGWLNVDFRLFCRLFHCTICNRSSRKLGVVVWIPDWQESSGHPEISVCVVCSLGLKARLSKLRSKIKKNQKLFVPFPCLNYSAAFSFLDASITQKDTLNPCSSRIHLLLCFLWLSVYQPLCTHSQPPLEKPIKRELKQLGISLQWGFPWIHQLCMSWLEKRGRWVWVLKVTWPNVWAFHIICDTS